MDQALYLFPPTHTSSTDGSTGSVRLSHLAVKRTYVSINTQKTALNALAFLYHKVLKIEPSDLDFQHAKQYRRLPSVLTPPEVALVLEKLDERNRLIFSLLYRSGLRITECVRLNVQDIGFTDNSITVRDGKGHKDRKTLLGKRLHAPLQSQIQLALRVQERDNSPGYGPSLPNALGRKYPNAFRQPAWMFLFSSSGLCNHPITREVCRHHLHDPVLRKALKIAVAKAEIY